MKKKLIVFMTALAAMLIPCCAYADVAAPGTIRVGGTRINLIPIILIIALIVIALVIILKAIKRKKNNKKSY